MLPNRPKDTTDPCYSIGQRIGLIHVSHWSMGTLTSINLKMYLLLSAEMAQLIARLTSTLRTEFESRNNFLNILGFQTILICIRFETYYVLKLNRFEEELVLFLCYTFRTRLRCETRPFWRVQVACFLQTVSYQNTLWNPHVLQPNRYEADRCETHTFWTRPFCSRS